MPAHREATYEYAIAGRALAGERQSGDAALVCPVEQGALIAVIDGLGHGDEAAAAAKLAVETFRAHAGEPLLLLMERCHAALQQTRGAALALALLDERQQTLSWVGVGNVEAVLIAAAAGHPHDKSCLTNRGGVVGYRLPPLEAKVTPVRPGDLLILATDGIDERFAYDEFHPGSPYDLAHGILDSHGKTGDDALVLVLRWLGPAGGRGTAP